jgi:hypothetical protein
MHAEQIYYSMQPTQQITWLLFVCQHDRPWPAVQLAERRANDHSIPALRERAALAHYLPASSEGDGAVSYLMKVVRRQWTV